MNTFEKIQRGTWATKRGTETRANKQTKHGIKVSETLLLLTVLFFKIFKVFCVVRPIRIVLPLKVVYFKLNNTPARQFSRFKETETERKKFTIPFGFFTVKEFA